jgi:hypothetical protein
MKSFSKNSLIWLQNHQKLYFALVNRELKSVFRDSETKSKKFIKNFSYGSADVLSGLFKSLIIVVP